MNWKTLMQDIPYQVIGEGNSEEITSIEYDSRKVRQGSAFVAVAGGAFDGHDFIAQAAEAGAVLAVVEKEIKEIPKGMCVVKVESTLAAMPRMAVRFYGRPSESMYMIGVTGTKGKTTTTTLIYRILMAAGRKTGLVGTIENRIGDEVLPSQYTTPQAFDLQQLFSQMREEEVHSLVMEVSSHSLALHRVDGTHFDLALFTNLSLDHLDFHKTMENYAKEKQKLFLQIKEEGTCFVNIDDAYASYFLLPDNRTLTYGMHASDYQISEVSLLENSSCFQVNGIEYEIKLLGKHNIYNMTCVIAYLNELQVEEKKIQEVVGMLEAPRGRMDVISFSNRKVMIDYAHTPDAVEKVLLATREIPHHKIVTILGCGGDRDAFKRPIMGKIATDLSDYVIFTSDNPRNEDPMHILNDITKSLQKKNFEVIENRKEAIDKGIQTLEKNDILLLLGKGHENYQIIHNTKYDFDDKIIAETIIEKMYKE